MQWESLIYSALQDLYTGLNKITFEETYSQKIINNLFNSISKAQQTHNEKNIKKREHLLLSEILFIQNALNDIVYNKKMSTPEAEMYFSAAANFFNSLFHENTTLQSFKDFSAKTSQLSQNIIVKTILKINKSHKHISDLLENALEHSTVEERYQDKIISCAAEAAAWFEREFYQLAFDHFYIHCIQLHNIIRNVNEVSLNEKNEAASQKKQIQLFSDMNLEALNTPEAQHYLNKLASNLGFLNLQNLYENFHNLNSQKELDAYCERKKKFFENENLHFAIKIILEELDRINALPVSLHNESYHLIITSLGEKYLAGIDACQHAKTLVLDFAANYFNEKDVTAITKKHDAELKSLIHEKFLFILSNEAIFEEKLIKNIAYQLNNEWLELRKKQTESERTDYNEILERVSSSSEEFILEHYLSSEEIRHEAFKNYKNALKTNPHHTPVDEKKELDLASKEYKNYKNAVQYKILRQVLNKKEIDPFIEEQSVKISAVNKKIKSLREQIAMKNKMLIELEAKKNPLDFLLSLFRYKSSRLHEKEITMNEIQKNISSLKRECELAEWEFTFYHLSKKIIDEQLNTYSLIKDLPISSLRREIAQRLDEYNETYKKIIACYMQSDPHEDIGEKLHALEIEYIKAKEIAQFTCDLLIEKLTKNPESFLELVNENALVLEKTYQTLREQKIKISHFNDGEPLLNSLSTLQPLIKTAIEKSMTILEKEKLPEYQEKIIAQLKNKDRDVLEDPFEYLLKIIFQKSSRTDKSIDSLFKINDIVCEAVEKIYCDFLEKNGSSFEVADLENIELQLLKKYYSYYIKPEKILQVNSYKKILSKIERVINDKYQAIYSSSFEIIKATLRSLDDRFIRFYITQIQYETEKASVLNIYGIWLNKLFGYAPPTSIICDVETTELAHSKAFHFFLERYLNTLQSYQKNLFSSWTLLKSSALNVHRDRIKKEYKIIQDELINKQNNPSPIIQKIVVAQNEILNFLDNRQQTNAKQDFSTLKSDRQKLLTSIKQLKRLSNKIESDIIKNNIFEESLFLEFSMLLDAAKNQVTNAENNLVELEKFYSQNHSNYKQWIAKKIAFENTLQYAKSTLDKIEKNEYHSFTIYSKINFNAVNDFYFDNPKYYGTALLLAIKKEDIPLAEKLVAEHGAEIHIQYLAMALSLALKNDHGSLFTKIANARKNISFSNAVLLDLISDSITLNRHHFILPILLDANVELDKKTSTLLRQSSLTQNDSLSPIEKNIFQYFFDSGSSFLEGLRQCYALEYALFLHLEAEYNALKLQKNVDDEQLIAFHHKIERASMLGQALLHFYLDSNQFELIDPVRKEKHITMWASQVEELKTHYINGLPNTPTSALYLKDFLRIKQKIIHAIDHAKQATEIFLTLEEIKNFLKNQYNDQFFRILSESIIHAVNHDRFEALDLFLSYLEDPKLKRELAYNAFCQAICSLRPRCLQYLLRMNAYEYDMNDAFIELSKLYYSNKDNPLYSEKVLAKSLLIEALTTIPLRFDPLINDFIDYLAQVDDTHITPNPHRDPVLTKIRNVYIFCEQAYHHIHEFENSQHLFKQINLHKAYATHQMNVIRKLKEHAIQSIFEEIKSTAFQQAQIALWEDELKNILKECAERFNAELEFVSNDLSSLIPASASGASGA